MSAEQEVAGAKRVALAVNDLTDPGPQRGQVGLLFLEEGFGRAIRPPHANRQRPGGGRGGDDVIGRNQAAQAFLKFRENGARRRSR